MRITIDHSLCKLLGHATLAALSRSRKPIRFLSWTRWTWTARYKWEFPFILRVASIQGEQGNYSLFLRISLTYLLNGSWIWRLCWGFEEHFSTPSSQESRSWTYQQKLSTCEQFAGYVQDCGKVCRYPNARSYGWQPTAYFQISRARIVQITALRLRYWESKMNMDKDKYGQGSRNLTCHIRSQCSEWYRRPWHTSEQAADQAWTVG